MDSFSRNKILIIVFLLSALFVGGNFLFLTNINAEEIADFSALKMPGTIEGIGIHFEITNSEYLNIILDSSEPIKLRMESIPEMITMMIESSASSTATSTQITLLGFIPSTKYYKYEDDYHNLTEFTTDNSGVYSYTQDISKSHFVFIQPRASTKFIKDDATGGDCAKTPNPIGTWNAATKTCVLSIDLTGTIQIDNNNITLDGNGRTITGSNTGYGVYPYGMTGVTVKNLNIKQFLCGISINYSSNNTLTGNTASNNYYGIYLFSSRDNTLMGNTNSNNYYHGIYLTYSSNNTLTGNIASSNNDGIVLYGSDNNTITNNTASNNTTTGIRLDSSDNNTLTGNTASNNTYGISINYSSNNTLIGNTASNNSYGIRVYGSSNNNQIYKNNFISNSTQAYISGGSGNIFNFPAPTGGNYWNNYDTPAEGCTDSNSDNFCDSPYIFTGGQDNLPWKIKDGWVAKTLFEKAANLAKLVINGPYLGDGTTWGGKGWDSKIGEYVFQSAIFSGYNFWNNHKDARRIEFGAGLDCSGLIQWAFNRSFDPQKSLLNNVIRYDGANGQYKNNSESVAETDLQPGDLLFLDKNSDNKMDHVAMYVGDNGNYDIVEAFSPERGIIPTNISEFKTRVGFDQNKHIRRVAISPSLGGQVKAGSPIDLVVTNPDGFTITPTTAIQTDEEYLREIPGELYYTESELGPDGRPEDIVYWPKQKIGNYIIKVIPEEGISPTETYNLEFQTGNQTIILAENIPLNQIPREGYGVGVTETGVITSFVPVAIDIKPGSFPNSINLGSKGTTPVAIFGSNTFDVYQINLNSITLAGAPIKPKKNGQLMVSYENVNGDGFIDIVIHVITESLQLISTDVKAELNGFLLDGREIKGSDPVRIVP